MWDEWGDRGLNIITFDRKVWSTLRRCTGFVEARVICALMGHPRPHNVRRSVRKLRVWGFIDRDQRGAVRLTRAGREWCNRI